MTKKIILSFFFVVFFIFSSFITSQTIYAESCLGGIGTCRVVCNSPETDGGPACRQGIRCCLPAGVTPPQGGGSIGGIDFNVIKVPGFNANFTNLGAIVSAAVPWVFGLA